MAKSRKSGSKKSSFARQQEMLWKTIDRLKDEYRRYLSSLSKEELLDELMEASVDRFYAAFTTDLVMNVFLEEGVLDEKEANALPIEYFRGEIAALKEKRLGKKKGRSQTAKKSKVAAARGKKTVTRKASKKSAKKKSVKRRTPKRKTAVRKRAKKVSRKSRSRK
jgi:predicted metal-dependent hydrolase